MARAVTIGNGNLLVGIDSVGQVRDLYFPFVGHPNHVSGASGNHRHRVGVFVDGMFSWLSHEEWNIAIGADDETGIGGLTATNERLGVRLQSLDGVHNEQDIFLRCVTVENLKDQERDIKVFFSQQFHISESSRGDTGYYDPRVSAIVHYKGRVTLLVNARADGKQFSEYNIGLFGIEGKEGTYLDAEDGVLSGNPIEHGSVDSVLACLVSVPPREKREIEYWIVCADSIPQAHTLDEYVLNETPRRLLDSTKAYWKAWTSKEDTDLSLFSSELQTLYHRSLIIVRVHTDNRGGIIASSDTDMLHHGRDTYSYVWPRDGALIARALDAAGYADPVKQFFRFIERCQEPDGYLMHKYRSDGVLGSSWHSWLHHGEPRLPIQEDETALLIYALWDHYERNRDLEFIESLYNSFIEPAAQFMVEYIEPSTGLPQASFDLWEEKYDTSTFTSAATVGGLLAASRFASLLGKESDARSYQVVAERMQAAILEHLYDEGLEMFVKHVEHDADGVLQYDKTVDSSSFYGIVLFDICPLEDERVRKSFATIQERLQVQADSQGFMRYEHDTYYTMQELGTPNPWVITTLWMAQYYIKIAEDIDDLAPAYELLEWTCSHATGAGVLAEQMHPHTREHLSTAPLVWSHAEFVYTMLEYQKRYESFVAASESVG